MYSVLKRKYIERRTGKRIERRTTENLGREGVLTIGPDYRNHRGGIGAVIEGCSRHFANFKFISTYKTLNKYIIPFYSAGQILKIIFYLYRNKSIGILHIHGSSRGSFFRKYAVFLIARYIFAKKIIYHIHSGEFHIFYANASKTTKRFIKHFIEQADLIICLSAVSEKFLTQHFHPRRTEIVPNFIDTKSYGSRGKNRSEKVIFLFLGKIVKSKGIFDLLEAAKQLVKQNCTDFEVWVGGDGEVGELKKFIDENRLADTVKFLGWISGDAKDKVLTEHDVFALPSYSENLPVSILEAMSNGKPVIATNVGGIPELIRDNVSGYLINPGDTRRLENCMKTFINNKKLIDEMGAKSLEIIDSGFTPQIVTEKINDLYSQLL